MVTWYGQNGLLRINHLSLNTYWPWPYLVTLSIDHIWSPYPLTISGHLIHLPYLVTIYDHYMVTIFAELLTDIEHIWRPYPLTISGHLIHWPYLVTIYMVTIFTELLIDQQTVTLIPPFPLECSDLPTALHYTTLIDWREREPRSLSHKKL